MAGHFSKGDPQVKSFGRDFPLHRGVYLLQDRCFPKVLNLAHLCGLEQVGRQLFRPCLVTLTIGAHRRQDVYPQWSQAQETSAGSQGSRSGHSEDEHSSGRHHLVAAILFSQLCFKGQGSKHDSSVHSTIIILNKQENKP